MKVTIQIKITPDPDKEGKERKEESATVNLEMSEGFGNVFPTEGLSQVGTEFIKSRMNQEPIYRPPVFHQGPLDEEYISDEELAEFRLWKSLQKDEVPK